jgi:hypothetical protein
MGANCGMRISEWAAGVVQHQAAIAVARRTAYSVLITLYFAHRQLGRGGVLSKEAHQVRSVDCKSLFLPSRICQFKPRQLSLEFATPTMPISLRQALKSTAAAFAGASPGIALWWFAGYPSGYGIVLSVLGAIVCVALSFPGVSWANVFGHTAGMIVAHNSCPQLGELVTNAITGESEEPEPDEPYRPAVTPPNFDFLHEAEQPRPPPAGSPAV